MNRLLAALALAASAVANAQEIEVTPPVLKPVAISAIASDGVDAIALWDSTLITRITNDGRSLTPTGTRIAPRSGQSAIVYGNGEYAVAVSGPTFDAIFLDRSGKVLRSVRLAEKTFSYRVAAAASNGEFLFALNDAAFVVDAAGNAIASIKLPETAQAAASDGTRFLVAGNRKAMLIDATGALVATSDYKPTAYYPSGVAAGFDGTSYVVGWTDRDFVLAQRVGRDGTAAGDAIALHAHSYDSLQAISEKDAVVFAMSATSEPFVVARVTAAGATAVLPPLDDGVVLAPIGSGFIAVKSTATFLTHDFAIDTSRPKGGIVAEAAESLRLDAAATNGTSVLAVWESIDHYDGLYAAVIGPNGITTPVALPHGGNVAAASNGKDFLVVYATGWYDGVYAVAIRADGTATRPASFRTIGFRHFVYLGAQWAGDAYLVGFADSFVDYGGTTSSYRQLISAGGTPMGTAVGGGPGTRFACGTTTCLAPGVGDHVVNATLFDQHGGTLTTVNISPLYTTSPAATNVVFDGANYRVFWSPDSQKVISRTVAESGSVVGDLLLLPSRVDATYAATRNGVFGAWSVPSNGIDTVFIDRSDNVAPGPRIATPGNVIATMSWLGESVLYARSTDDPVHGSATRIFLRPVTLRHGRVGGR